MSATKPLIAEPRRGGSPPQVDRVGRGARHRDRCRRRARGAPALALGEPCDHECRGSELGSRRPAGARVHAPGPARQAREPCVLPRPAGDRHVHRSALPGLLSARGDHPHPGRGATREGRPGDRVGQRRPVGRLARQLPRRCRALAARARLALGHGQLRRARPRLEELLTSASRWRTRRSPASRSVGSRTPAPPT